MAMLTKLEKTKISVMMSIWERWPLGGFLLHQVLAGSKQRLAAVAYTQNKAPNSINFQIEPSQAALKPIL